jgi:hypothetical protein
MPARTLALLLIALASTAAIAGCGESEEDKAKADVCDARDDIKKQIDTLQGLTLSTATLSQVSDSVKAIGEDLRKIADVQSDLSDERRQQIQQANAEFGDTVQQIASQVTRSLSIQQAATQFKDAVEKAASSYKDSFATFDCG